MWFIGIRLGLGKLRYHTGGPGGLLPGLGFGLGKLRDHTRVRGHIKFYKNYI